GATRRPARRSVRARSVSEGRIHPCLRFGLGVETRCPLPALQLLAPVVRQERPDLGEQADVGEFLLDAFRVRVLQRLTDLLDEQLGEQAARPAQLLAE